MPVKINKHIVNLVCCKCDLVAAVWETELIDGIVRGHTQAERELLK
jgi:hypothetical protein